MISKTPEETRRFGRKLAVEMAQGGVICLFGDLGAGKTTLVQGLAQGLGIKRRIVSPTFIIVRKYDNFWHVDLYRLTALDEAKAVGIEEIIADQHNIVVIEWPEIIKAILPEHYIEIKIRAIDAETREIDETIH
jgi:tRNA threonylcarbamoyladenosine biosynthesis protein TsaE